MKFIILVPDGMTDEPLKELGYKTPLEVARTTNMDYLASNGMIGMAQTIPKNMAPGSDVGNLALLGYDPKKYLSGRAPLEAASMDIELRDNEVAFRLNLVTVYDNIMHDYSAGHIKTEEAKEIIETLKNEINNPNVRFFAGKSYRHLLILKVRDPKQFCKIESTPPHDILGSNIERHLPKGPESDLLLSITEKSKNVLENHPVNKVRQDLGENPANMIWLWGQGIKPQIPKFHDIYGLKGGIISAVDLVNGIGKLAGLEIIDVEGITGYYDTNFLGKARAALEHLKRNDLVFIHVEAPDEASHNGDTENKIKSLERIDEDILGTILNHFEVHDDVRILVSADHPTPISIRTHTSEPVNFVMYGKGIEPEHNQNFSEKTAQEKGVIFSSGEEMIRYFTKKFL